VHARDVVLTLSVVATAACATYTDRVLRAWQAASDGGYADAIASMNAALGVDSADALPERWNGDRPLAVLERAVLLQAQGRYDTSRRDLTAVEQELEVLDLSADAIGALGRYLYSDSSRTYRAPPSERLALNALNLLNHLALGDLGGAAVEARRFTVAREHLATEGVERVEPAALGAYLSGVVFERLGEGDRALRYYDEALAAGPLPSLTLPVGRLAARHPYRGPRLLSLLETAGHLPDERPADGGELLIVVAAGRVPYKVPERVPVGVAVAAAGAYATGDWEVLEYAATKVLVYPGLAPSPTWPGPPRVSIDGDRQPLDLVADLGAAVRAEYRDARPRILAAALTRMTARGGVAEGVRQAGAVHSDGAGAVAAILAEAALVALDRPDTRSWTFLPDRVFAARARVPAGAHTIEVGVGAGPGTSARRRVEVGPGGFAALVITEPR
jgi:hypothetical protein